MRRLQWAVDHPVDIVLLDLSLPGGPSLPMIEQLLQDSSARVVVLTMHDDPAYARGTGVGRVGLCRENDSRGCAAGVHPLGSRGSVVRGPG